MKIFITGIAGFIGFHLARELKAYGHDVLGCDNYNGMYSPHLKMDRCKVLEMAEIPVKNVDEVLKIALTKPLKRVEWVEVDQISKKDKLKEELSTH